MVSDRLIKKIYIRGCYVVSNVKVKCDIKQCVNRATGGSLCITHSYAQCEYKYFSEKNFLTFKSKRLYQDYIKSETRKDTELNIF